MMKNNSMMTVPKVLPSKRLTKLTETIDEQLNLNLTKEELEQIDQIIRSNKSASRKPQKEKLQTKKVPVWTICQCWTDYSKRLTNTRTLSVHMSEDDALDEFHRVADETVRYMERNHPKDRVARKDDVLDGKISIVIYHLERKTYETVIRIKVLSLE